MDARLGFAIELEGRDTAVAERLELLSGLEHGVDAARAEAVRIAGALVRLPAERERLEASAEAAAGELARATASLEAAEGTLARARGDAARALAERARAVAAADVRAAAARVERTAALREELERDARRAQADELALVERVALLAGGLREAPRVSHLPEPGRTLGEVVEWAARAHAALVVARSGLETERERIVREANELASAVLGEPLAAGSVALVRHRLEERLG